MIDFEENRMAPATLKEFMNKTRDEDSFKGVYDFEVTQVDVRCAEDIFGSSAMDNNEYIVMSDGITNLNLKIPIGISYEDGEFTVEDARRVEKSYIMGKSAFWKFIKLYGYPRTGLTVKVQLNDKGYEKLVL